MIGCLPTQALAFLTVFVYATQRTQLKRLRLNGNRALVATNCSRVLEWPSTLRNLTDSISVVIFYGAGKLSCFCTHYQGTMVQISRISLSYTLGCSQNYPPLLGSSLYRSRDIFHRNFHKVSNKFDWGRKPAKISRISDSAKSACFIARYTDIGYLISILNAQ